MQGTGDSLSQMMAEQQERRAQMNSSSWIAAQPGGQAEYEPISATPLDSNYQRSKATAQSGLYHRTREAVRSDGNRVAPASIFIASKYAKDAAQAQFISADETSIVLGSDPTLVETSNSAYGAILTLPGETIDLLKSVEQRRDTTLDGSHRASMTEKHVLNIHNPYVSEEKVRAASFQSAGMLREGMHRHVRSQYHPEQKYTLPPTVQNDIGWGISDKYTDACAKYQDGAAWHGRTGSHITKFSERLLLGARSHLSGPMTNPKLHY